MPRCETCTHWTLGSWVSDGYGQCDVATYGTHVVKIQLHGMGDTLLETAPDFGCVLHEPKGDAT